jgi:hypothetical protein
MANWELLRFGSIVITQRLEKWNSENRIGGRHSSSNSRPTGKQLVRLGRCTRVDPGCCRVSQLHILIGRGTSTPKTRNTLEQSIVARPK